MSSRHEMGLAVDFGGVLTNSGNGGTKAAKRSGSSARNSSLYKWMMKNVHGKTQISHLIAPGTTSTKQLKSGGKSAMLKNYTKEPWHWSYDGR